MQAVMIWKRRSEGTVRAGRSLVMSISSERRRPLHRQPKRSGYVNGHLVASDDSVGVVVTLRIATYHALLDQYSTCL